MQMRGSGCSASNKMVKMNGKLFLLVLIFSCVATSTGQRTSSQPPNILFLMADQMRADLLSCAGNKISKTPNLDQLATEGVRYTNAFSTTPTCTPARAAILTGLSPWYHGMLGYGQVANRYDFEMPRALCDAGYYTCSIGKDHFGWNSTANDGIDHGYHQTDLYDGLENELDNYDRWLATEQPGVNPMATGLGFNDYRGAAYALPEYYYPTAWVSRGATSFIESYNRTDPFFLKVSFHRPHSPYDPPERWMEKFNRDDMPPRMSEILGTRNTLKRTMNHPLQCGMETSDWTRSSDHDKPTTPVLVSSMNGLEKFYKLWTERD